MKIDFIVHRVSSHKTSVMVEVNGEKMSAEVDSLEVELTTVAPQHGTLTLRFIGSEAAQAKEEFKEGETVVMTSAPVTPAAEG